MTPTINQVSVAGRAQQLGAGAVQTIEDCKERSSTAALELGRWSKRDTEQSFCDSPRFKYEDYSQKYSAVPLLQTRSNNESIALIRITGVARARYGFFSVCSVKLHCCLWLIFESIPLKTLCCKYYTGSTAKSALQCICNLHLQKFQTFPFFWINESIDL